MNAIADDKKASLIKACMALAIVSTSFDIFANIDIGGYNFRFTQIIIMPVLFFFVVDSFSSKKIELPIGGKSILLWTLVQWLFIVRSPQTLNAVEYALYLLFDVLTIFSVVYCCNRAFTIQWLLKIYLDSFCLIAIFGLIQFILYPAGINLYVAQAWMPSLARINGFSYEPSFYSTYLLMGFVAHAYIFEKKDETLFSLKKTRLNLIIIAVSLFLSSSRMGWLMMGIWIGLRLLNAFKKFIVKSISKKALITAIICTPLLFLAVFLAVTFIQKKSIDLTFLISGLGIFGASAHSSNDRINGLTTCLNIFLESPLLGYSLGGVDPMIAKYNGVIYQSGDNGASMSILGEVLVASGIVGMIPLISYFAKLIFRKDCWKNNTTKYAVIQRALVWALIFEIAILCFNQNILRAYLWMHIAILSALIKVYKCNKADI